MPYVILNEIKNIRQAGVLRTFLPGDTVKVGTQTALEWILDGSAQDPFGQVGPSMHPEDLDGTEYAMRIMGVEGSISLADLGPYAESLQISYGFPDLPLPYTCIWHPTKRTTQQVVSYGFLRIMKNASEVEAWEMAAMLRSLTQQAGDYGSEEEQERTLKAIGDLRFPLYDARIVWVRKTPTTEAVVEQWSKELKEKADLYHSFIRALYMHRAMLCTLPMDCFGR